jgi:hypothetical protein
MNELIKKLQFFYLFKNFAGLYYNTSRWLFLFKFEVSFFDDAKIL